MNLYQRRLLVNRIGIGLYDDVDGRLVRVAAHTLDLDAGRDYHAVYPETLRDDPAVRAFCDWLHAEFAALQQRLRETAAADR